MDKTRPREHLVYEIATIEPLTIRALALSVGRMKLAVESCPLIVDNGELVV